jgi:hypothetical protein
LGSITRENIKICAEKTAVSIHLSINLLYAFGGILQNAVMTRYKTKENIFSRGEVVRR